MDEKLSPIKKRGFYTGWNWISFVYNLYNTKHFNFWVNSEGHLIFIIDKVDKSQTSQKFQTLEKHPLTRKTRKNFKSPRERLNESF